MMILLSYMKIRTKKMLNFEVIACVGMTDCQGKAMKNKEVTYVFYKN